MQLEYLIEQLMNHKNYDQNLIEATKELLHEMVKLFGEAKTLAFFKEYTLIPRDRIGSNSGVTNKEEKTIGFDWACQNKHEALTLLIHEAGHALGSLEAAEDHFLMEGFQTRDAFLTKLEEAVVSQKQDELEYGELDYSYVTINNLENDEEFHRNNFKTQPSHKYTINKVFHQNLMILLGKNSVLINKLMYEDDLDTKKNILDTIIKQLENTLTDEEFILLKDCANVFVLNFSYFGSKETVESRLKNKETVNKGYGDMSYEEYLSRFFSKNFQYATERHLLSKNIFTAVDDLCGITLNVLLSRFAYQNRSAFDNIKETSEYFSKIYSTAPQNSPKTELLKALYIKNIAQINPVLYQSFIVSGYNNDDFIEIISKIIATNDFQENHLKEIFYDQSLSKFFVPEAKDYRFTKEPIYDGDFDGMFFPWSKPEPIGYNFVVTIDEAPNLSNELK